MKTYFEKDFAKISYCPSGHHVFHEWLIPPTVLEFKEGCNQLVEAFKHFKTGKLIVDTREQGTVAGELLEWMTTDWITRAIAAGHTHSAVIIPSDVFASMSVDEIMDTVSKQITSRHFDTVDDALDWITQQ